MSEQKALSHDPDRSGYWRSILNPDRTVNDGAWRAKWAAGSFVGTCRACGGYLKATKPRRLGLTDWYDAVCIAVECRYETSHHGPRPAAKKITWRPA